MRIAIYLVLTICICTSSCAQSLRPSEVTGRYKYISTDSLSGIRLELTKDGMFQYSAGGDVQTMYSSGKWKLNKDTLIMNSSIDRKNIPIAVKEEIVDSIRTNVKVELVQNLDGEALENAVFRFNNDTLNECVPFFESDCGLKIGSINNLRVELNNGVSSKWVELKNKRANLLKVTVSIHGMLGSYLFLVNQRYLYKNGSLYPLPITQITELDLRKGETVKREVVLQKIP